MPEKLMIEPRVFEMDVPISGPCDLPFEDWPSHIQDGIYAAMQRVADREGIELRMELAQYKTDFDLTPDDAGYHYLHIIIREVVRQSPPGLRLLT